MVRIRFGVYDSSVRSANGSHWQWQHSDLRARLLDTFYYEVVSPQIHTPAIEPASDAVFAAIDDQWCCWYRVFNAGRDSLGRPGRFLVATALMRRSDVVEVDTTGVLELQFFHEVASAAGKPAPMTRPSETEQIYKVEAFPFDAQILEQLQRGDVVEFQGPNGLKAVAVACSRITPPARWRLDVRSWATQGLIGGQALVTCLPAATHDRASSQQEQSEDLAAPLDPVRGVRRVALGIFALVVIALAVVAAAFWYRHSRPQMHPPNRSSSQPRVERKVNSPSPRIERPPSRRPGIPSHDSSTRSC